MGCLFGLASHYSYSCQNQCAIKSTLGFVLRNQVDNGCFTTKGHNWPISKSSCQHLESTLFFVCVKFQIFVTLFLKKIVIRLFLDAFQFTTVAKFGYLLWMVATMVSYITKLKRKKPQLKGMSLLIVKVLISMKNGVQIKPQSDQCFGQHEKKPMFLQAAQTFCMIWKAHQCQWFNIDG